MARKLKVYRTPIGFHDAYVAASSQKAALAAWGTDANLFARGAAELVTDEALTREPLADPGKVIRRARGTTAEYLAALPADAPRPEQRRRPPPDEDADEALPKATRTTRAARRDHPRVKPKAPPKPRPSRAALDAAERAIEEAQALHDAATAELRRREKTLQEERRALEHDHDQEMTKLAAATEKERQRYAAALDRWRRT